MDIENLISNANDISNKIKGIQTDHYNKRKEEKGNFNFFSAIVSGKNDKQHIEKYHSNVIGYFLDPNASHDFGALFLKKFIEILSDKGITDLPGEQEVEDIELIREKQTAAGRFIDISLEVGKWIIFIENKIRSGEQQNQMKDYFDFAKKYKNRLGIYLTLEGKEPESIKTEGCDGNLICMSYDDIIVWLQSCCKNEEVKTYPHVLSALKQYITVIENLLETMKEDKKAIRKHLLENKEKTVDLVKNFEILQDSISELIKEVRNKFKEDLDQEISKTNTNISENINISIIQGHYYNYYPSGDGEYYGMGFRIDRHNEPYYEYGGNAYREAGNGIFIDGINAHMNIDETNAILLSRYKSDGWEVMVKSIVKAIIEEVEGKVFPEYKKNEN